MRDDEAFNPTPTKKKLLLLLLLLLSFDEVKPRQINASKRLAFDVPFLEFSLRKPQMEDLQAVLHLLKVKIQFLDIRQKYNKALVACFFPLTTRKIPSPRAFRHLL
jgi:hypothetical protein